MVLGAIATSTVDFPFGSWRAVGVELKSGFGGQGELCFWNTKDIRFVQTNRGSRQVIAKVRHKGAAHGRGRIAINRVTASGVIRRKAEEMK